MREESSSYQYKLIAIVFVLLSTLNIINEFQDLSTSFTNNLYRLSLSSEIPNPNPINLESRMITPSRPPLTLVIIELRRSTLRVIRPRLASNSISEIPSSPTDSQVDNQIELLIEGRTFVLGGLPRIVPALEACFLPVGLIGVVYLEDSVGIGV